MRYFAGFAESFHYAYIHGPEVFKKVSASRITKLDGCVTKAADIDRICLEQYGLLPAPASGPGSLGPGTSGRHPLVAGEGNRHGSIPVTRHEWNSPVPLGAFALVGSGVYVSTPEFTFLQLSREMSAPMIALVGCVLCASYRLDMQTGQIVRCDPLCTVDSLRAFLDRADGVRGVRIARGILDTIADGAESPQEINMYLLASLPLDLGGSAIDDLALNFEIGVDEKDAPILDRATRKSFRIDMGVPSLGVGVEYLGKHHELQQERDRERQNALLAKGKRILQVKYQDISDPVRTERLACQLAALLGREVPKRTPSQEVAHVRLLDLLFGTERPQL